MGKRGGRSKRETEKKTSGKTKEQNTGTLGRAKNEVVQTTLSKRTKVDTSQSEI